MSTFILALLGIYSLRFYFHLLTAAISRDFRNAYQSEQVKSTKVNLFNFQMNQSHWMNFMKSDNLQGYFSRSFSTI